MSQFCFCLSKDRNSSKTHRWQGPSSAVRINQTLPTVAALALQLNIDTYTDMVTSILNLYQGPLYGHSQKRSPGLTGKSVPNLKHRLMLRTWEIWTNTEQRKSSYTLQGASSAKKRYRGKVEFNYQGSSTRNMWSGLTTNADYKRKISSAEIMSASLPSELNTYARFENNFLAEEVQKAQDPCPLIISGADVCRCFERINHARHLDLMASLAVSSRCAQINSQMSSQTFSTSCCSSL